MDPDASFDILLAIVASLGCDTGVVSGALIEMKMDGLIRDQEQPTQCLHQKVVVSLTVVELDWVGQTSLQRQRQCPSSVR